MAPRLATAYLVCLLAGGCASKPTVQQDITLATADVSGNVQTVPARNSARMPQAAVDTTAAPVVMSGSGGATNIVSDPSVETNRSASTANRAAPVGAVAIPSPVQAPTRLATAVMIEPAASLST